MRHLRSILYVSVLAPSAWILCGVGLDENLTGRARDNGGIESLGGLLLLFLAGAAYGILLFAPISPAGPLLAGATFIAIGTWARFAPDSYASIWPAEVTKEGFNISTPGYGLTVLLAVPLICTALSARRWAGYEPPRVVWLGVLGRARGEARAPGTPIAAEPTTAFPAAVPHQRRPIDDEEKTTLLAGLFEPAPPSERTVDVAESSEATTALPTAALPIPPASVPPAPPASSAPASSAPSASDGDKTQVIRPALADSAAEPDPGDEATRPMSITGEERPDPAQDPTTRLTPVPPKPPGEATTRPTTTATHQERPADEAADDTRPLNLPHDEDQTRRLP
ncbi:hypothetical protein Asp14428_36040 [Actinoplanes sp. NBRC 14428]|nr:hypothetical protein Asp14428_36040 [Actinoplanes sp. NBRC 14428]